MWVNSDLYFLVVTEDCNDLLEFQMFFLCIFGCESLGPLHLGVLCILELLLNPSKVFGARCCGHGYKELSVPIHHEVWVLLGLCELSKADVSGFKGSGDGLIM